MPALPGCPCGACRIYRETTELNRSNMRQIFGLNSFERTTAMPTSIFTGDALDDIAGPQPEELDEPPIATCVVCGDENHPDDMVEPADNWIRNRYSSTRRDGSGMACRDCVTYCDECGDYFRYMSDHQDSFCDRCDTYFCGQVSMTYCDDCDMSRCYDCGECSCYSGTSIRSYDWQPPEFVMKGDRSQVMMGIELEVSGRESVIVDCVKQHDDCEDHLYMKHDGSVNGVEIVTHPGTLEWNRNEFDWAQLLEDMSNEGCDIDLQENGLHVHVARDSFARGKTGKSSRHQMTWLMFLYRNADDLQLLARRNGGRWAAFNAPMGGELKSKAQRIERGDRYVAVNCNNRDTYELRFFASTLNPVEFFAAIEFADASVEYTRQLRAADVMRGNGMSWSAFIDWADQQDGRYAALCAEGRRRVPPRAAVDNKPWYPVRNMPARASW